MYVCDWVKGNLFVGLNIYRMVELSYWFRELYVEIFCFFMVIGYLIKKYFVVCFVLLFSMYVLFNVLYFMYLGFLFFNFVLYYFAWSYDRECV